MNLGTIIGFFNPALWPFAAAFILATALLSFLGWPFFVIGAVLTTWCFYFFRDPPRLTPTRVGLIVSPADGKVVGVQEVMPDPTLGLGDEMRMRISIFLNVFDVHVNRMPSDGIVRARHYRTGKFVHAARDKASIDNERMVVVLQLTGDHQYAERQSRRRADRGLHRAPHHLPSRRRRCFKAGERYGLIRFGSRADIYLPPGLAPLVAVGQYMIGGETVLADCASAETIRHAEERE